MVVEVVILSEELGPADVLYHNRVSLSNSTITSRFKNCTVFGEFQQESDNGFETFPFLNSTCSIIEGMTNKYAAASYFSFVHSSSYIWQW